jgi:hypothetical protein
VEVILREVIADAEDRLAALDQPPIWRAPSFAQWDHKHARNVQRPSQR